MRGRGRKGEGGLAAWGRCRMVELLQTRGQQAQPIDRCSRGQIGSMLGPPCSPPATIASQNGMQAHPAPAGRASRSACFSASDASCSPLMRSSGLLLSTIFCGTWMGPHTCGMGKTALTHQPAQTASAGWRPRDGRAGGGSCGGAALTLYRFSHGCSLGASWSSGAAGAAAWRAGEGGQGRVDAGRAVRLASRPEVPERGGSHRSGGGGQSAAQARWAALSRLTCREVDAMLPAVQPTAQDHTYQSEGRGEGGGGASILASPPCGVGPWTAWA